MKFWWAREGGPEGEVLNMGKGVDGHMCVLSNSHHSFYFFFFIKEHSYNIKLTINHFKVYNLVAFSAFTIFCRHHHYLISEYLITPKENSIPISSHFPFTFFLPTPPNLWQLLIYVLSPQIYLFWKIIYDSSFKVFVQ